MQGYTLKTLGELAVLRSADRPPLGPPRESGLLVYLAFNIGRSLQREKLIGILWNSGTSSERRHGLSQLIYSLRRRYALLEIATTRDTVRLDSGIAEVDALTLLDRVDRADMEAGCEIFNGPFLEGFYIAGARGFEDWRESMARDVNGAGSRALGSRLREAYGSGNWWLVERMANRLLELDPYDEHSHAQRVRAIAASGDQTRAVRELERTVDLIRRDLGQLPGQELRELINLLGSGIVPADAETRDEPPMSRFVGRTGEFRELRSVWTSVMTARGAAVAVRGEAGIGKSRLCRQFLRVAAIEGGRVLAGRCFESGNQIPFSGICEAFRDIREPDAADLAPQWRATLHALLPELGGRSVGNSAERLDTEGEMTRRKLFEAVVQLITTLARRRPVAIFLDDVHWADASTKELMHYIAHATSNAAVLLLVALRPEELEPDAVVQLTDGFNVLSLDRLTSTDALELIGALDAQNSFELPAALQEKIHIRGAGRPFLIVELTRYLGSRRRSANDAGIKDVPTAVEMLLVRRLRSLSKAARHTLDVLTVIGGEATVTLLERATRLSPRRLVTALEELHYRQIICERGSTYAFTHDLMREAVERRVSSARRRWLHKAAALALQRMPRQYPGTIALHMRDAGDSASAYAYALDAAAQNQSLYAHSEATFFLRLAVAAAPDFDARRDALGRLCRHLYGLADLPAVRRIVSELRPWYAENGDRHGMLMATVAELDSAFLDTKNSALDLRMRATALAELIGGSLETIEAPAVGLIMQISQSAYEAGHKDFIEAFSDAVLKEAEQHPANSNCMRHLAVSASAYAVFIDAASGYNRARIALQMADSVSDPASQLEAHIACAAASTLCGMYSDAFRHFASAEMLLDDGALRHRRRRITANYAVLLMETGRLEEAATVLEAAIGTAANHDRLFLYGNLALTAMERQDWSSVQKYARALEDANQVLRASWASTAVKMLDGFVALAERDGDRARALAAELSAFIGAGSDVAAGVLDTSYMNILFARVGLLGPVEEATAARLEEAADTCRGTNVAAAVRLDLERAWVLRAGAPAVATKIARNVLEWAERSGGRLAAVRAKEILRTLGEPAASRDG